MSVKLRPGFQYLEDGTCMESNGEFDDKFLFCFYFELRERLNYKLKKNGLYEI